TVTLSAMAADLDVFVLQDTGTGCDPANCVAHGDVSTSFAATAGATYYLVVDGRAGAAGPFTLTTDCGTTTSTCAPVADLPCGGSDSRSTLGAGSSLAVDSYPACFVPDATGPERVCTLTATAAGDGATGLPHLHAAPAG